MASSPALRSWAAPFRLRAPGFSPTGTCAASSGWMRRSSPLPPSFRCLARPAREPPTRPPPGAPPGELASLHEELPSLRRRDRPLREGAAHGLLLVLLFGRQVLPQLPLLPAVGQQPVPRAASRVVSGQ